jgi:SNF2 family DNA or RNA helicase
MAHTLSGHKREAAWFSKQGDLVTCTPDTLVRFLESVSKYERLPVARLVIDESQLFKNPAATRTLALLALSEHLPTWLLSGTPTPNGVLDAWAPGYLLSQGDAFWH